MTTAILRRAWLKMDGLPPCRLLILRACSTRTSSAVNGRRPPLFGSSMDISAAARDAFGLTGSGHPFKALAAGPPRPRVDELSEASGSGEVFERTGFRSQFAVYFAGVGHRPGGCSASCRRQGLGLIWMLRPTLWWTSMRWRSRSTYVCSPAPMSAPTSSNFEDLVRVGLFLRPDWIGRACESGLVWALATAMERPCWHIPRSNLLRFGGGSSGRGRDDVQHQTPIRSTRRVR